jgi:hypothetical protein
VILYNNVKVAFTLGDLDTKGNLQDPLKIIKYVNSYGEISMTFPAPQSMDGYTFYGIPIYCRKCKYPILYNAYLVFFDSNTNDCHYINGHD